MLREWGKTKYSTVLNCRGEAGIVWGGGDFSQNF